MRPPTASYRAWATRMIDQWGSRAAALRRDPARHAQIRAACIESTVADLRAALDGHATTDITNLSIARHQLDMFA